jgi:CDP-glucose 4,6-dehydratase
MSYWDGKRVLVTGCTGFVGGWLAKRLVDEGAKVIGLVWDPDPHAVFYLLGLDRCVACVSGDITDLPLLEKVLSANSVDTVFHLAAQALVTRANLSPLETFETNAKGTWVLLEAIRRARFVKRVVVASSDKAYGEQKDLPYRESSPLCPTNPYDVSKACADLIAQSYAKTFHLPEGIVRSGNIYGGGDLSFDRLIPGTVRAAFNNENPVIRSDGTYTRDYLYVADAVDAYLQVAKAMDEERFHGEAFNFGNERPFTVLEVVADILDLMACRHLTPVIQSDAPAEIQHQYLSAAKAREQLGWSSVYSLKEGLCETISWYEAYLSGKVHGTSKV